MAELKATQREVFVPLSHPPGEAQVDFGHALVNLNGTLKKCPFFVMSLPCSDAFYLQVFERECTESFWEGHVRAFRFFGAVPRRISYDNTRIAVAQMLVGRERKLTDGFLQLQSHYLFKEHFCRPARGNEKGGLRALSATADPISSCPCLRCALWTNSTGHLYPVPFSALSVPRILPAHQASKFPLLPPIGSQTQEPTQGWSTASSSIRSRANPRSLSVGDITSMVISCRSSTTTSETTR